MSADTHLIERIDEERQKATEQFRDEVLPAELEELTQRRVVMELVTPESVLQLLEIRKRTEPLAEDPSWNPELAAECDRDKVTEFLGQWRANGRPPEDALGRLLTRLIRQEIQKDVVGLAFSGGGIRSASFNLGLLQAVHESGMLKRADYLSTVSGGGYIGSYLSSALLDQKDGLAKGDLPLTSKTTGEQPSEVLRLVHGGSYLNHPVRLFNRYLIGLVFNNLVFLSGVLFVCALLAYAWRWLDHAPVHTFIVWVSNELFLDYLRPFLPALVLLVGWLLVWSALYWDWLTKKSNRAGKLVLEASIALGLVLVAWRQPHSTLRIQYDLAGLVLFWLVVVAISHAFAVWPTARTKVYSASKGLLLATLACFLIGAATWLGNPNINTQSQVDSPGAKDPGSYLTIQRALIVPLLVVLAVCLLPFLRPWDLLKSGEREKGQWQFAVFRVANYALLVGMPLAVVLFFARHNVSGQGDRLHRPLVSSDIRDWELFWRRVFQEAGGQHQAARAAAGVWGSPLTPAPGWALAVTAEGRLAITPGPAIVNLLAANQTAGPEARDVFRMISQPEELARLKKTGDQFQQPVAWQDWQQIEHDQNRIAAALNEVLRTPAFTDAVAPQGAAAEDFLKELKGRKEHWQKLNKVEQEELARLLERRARELSLDDNQQNALNQLLLRAFYPDDLWPRTMVRRLVTIEADQQWRGTFVLGALVVFALAAFVVNINATSPHWFYYDQLRQAYIKPKPSGSSRIGLTELENTLKGGPYHLLSATVDLGPECRDHLLPFGSFLFSKRYCGSHQLGYEASTTYQGGEVDLGTAMAISGAAFSPLRVHNPLVAVLMTILNLRLGQWFPKPGSGRAVLRRIPNLVGLLCDRIVGWWTGDVHRRRFFFLTDGGYEENLGIEPLLQRRCALIVASDAGQDEEHRFTDLAKLYRRARLQGIRFSELGREEMPLSLDGLRLRKKSRTCRAHFIFARILYPDRGEPGLLVYLKPSCTGDEELDLRHHRIKYPAFPHDPTSDVVYDANQVESYRQLGHRIGKVLWGELTPQSWGDCVDVGRLIENLVAKQQSRGSPRAMRGRSRIGNPKAEIRNTKSEIRNKSE